MPTNDWKVNPNGQGYVQRIGAAGRSDVLDWARTVLAPRVQQFFKEFYEKHQWGDPGQGAIDAYADAASSAGTDQGRGQAWQGRSVRESVAAAVGRLSVNGRQQ